ncbi:MAG TPA: hypothetical protein VGM06_11035 [Polyangiaceae bacterium]
MFRSIHAADHAIAADHFVGIDRDDARRVKESVVREYVFGGDAGGFVGGAEARRVPITIAVRVRRDQEQTRAQQPSGASSRTR